MKVDPIKVNIKAKKVEDGTVVSHETKVYNYNGCHYAHLEKMIETLFTGKKMSFKKDEVELIGISFCKELL